MENNSQKKLNESASLNCSTIFTVDEKKILNAVETVRYSTSSPGEVYTVDDAVNKVGYRWFQVELTVLAGLGWAADAFEIIILSVIGDYIACDWKLYRWENALLTSSVFAGMMIGSPVFGMTADIYGRKKALAMSMILLFSFGALSAASPSFVWMAILRGLMGFALGGVAQGLTLCCEYFPANVRGKAGFYLCYFWSVGTVGVILMAWGIMIRINNWRVLLLAASLPALIVIITLKWYPESARYYLVSNRHEEAVKILERMARMNGKELPSGRLVEVTECTKRGRIKDLLSKEYRRSTLLFWYIWLAVAFTYYGVALLTPNIIQNGGLDLSPGQNFSSNADISDFNAVVACTPLTNRNYIDILWTSSAEFPGLVVYTFLVEHCNRRVLLGSSCGICAILVFLLLVQTKHSVIIFLFLFGARAIIVAVFQLIFIMTSESFPTTFRAIAMGSGSAFCRLGGLIVPYVAQVLVVKSPVAAISLLGVVISLAGVASLLLPLETRGADMKESHMNS